MPVLAVTVICVLPAATVLPLYVVTIPAALTTLFEKALPLFFKC